MQFHRHSDAVFFILFGWGCLSSCCFRIQFFLFLWTSIPRFLVTSFLWSCLRMLLLRHFRVYPTRVPRRNVSRSTRSLDKTAVKKTEKLLFSHGIMLLKVFSFTCFCFGVILEKGSSSTDYFETCFYATRDRKDSRPVTCGWFWESAVNIKKKTHVDRIWSSLGLFAVERF